MISIDVIQRSAQMLLPDLDGCYWVISIHENTHGVPPDQRLQKELAALLPLPAPGPFSAPRLADAPRRALPVESIQHPLSVYQSLLEERS